MTALHTAIAVEPLAAGLLFSGTAKLFAICNPTAAFIYGATSHLSAITINAVFDKANIRTDTIVSKAAIAALSIIGGILATAFLTGYQFTARTLLLLSLGTIPVVVGGALAIGAVVIAVRMHRDHCNAENAMRSLSMDCQNTLNRLSPSPQTA